MPSTSSVEHCSHEIDEQGFEELKTDIKAEESSVDEQFSVPVWHKADEAHSTATDDKFEECARESPVAAEEPEAEDAYAELEDEEAPVEVRPVALSEDQVQIGPQVKLIQNCHSIFICTLLACIIYMTCDP